MVEVWCKKLKIITKENFMRDYILQKRPDWREELTTRSVEDGSFDDIIRQEDNIFTKKNNQLREELTTRSVEHESFNDITDNRITSSQRKITLKGWKLRY